MESFLSVISWLKNPFFFCSKTYILKKFDNSAWCGVLTKKKRNKLKKNKRNSYTKIKTDLL